MELREGVVHPIKTRPSEGLKGIVLIRCRWVSVLDELCLGNTRRQGRQNVWLEVLRNEDSSPDGTTRVLGPQTWWRIYNRDVESRSKTPWGLTLFLGITPFRPRTKGPRGVSKGHPDSGTPGDTSRRTVTRTESNRGEDGAKGVT